MNAAHCAAVGADCPVGRWDFSLRAPQLPCRIEDALQVTAGIDHGGDVGLVDGEGGGGPRRAGARAPGPLRDELGPQLVIQAPIRGQVRFTKMPQGILATGGFHGDVGRSAVVTATVRCSLPLADLMLPGLPGSLLVEASAVSALDRYRARG